MNRILLTIILILVLNSCSNRHIGFYKNIRDEQPVFYQILIDRFYDARKTNNFKVDLTNPYGFHGGDLYGIFEKVGYLRELGINAVILSPVIDNVDKYVNYKGYKHYGYHGYWPEDFNRIEEHFGDFKILSSLSEEFHRNGIAYIQDIVLNHSGYKSIWEKNSFWVRSPVTGGCIDNDDLRQCLFGLPDFKTERDDVRRYLTLRYKELLRKGGYDGVRIDAMKHIDKIMVKELFDELRKVNSDIISIGEYWGSSADSKGISLLNEYGTDFLFDFDFRDYLSGFLRGALRDLVFVSYLNNRYEIADKNFIVFLNNHDLDGLITQFDDMNEADIGKVYRLMALMQFICGGNPIIYYGEENGLKVGKGIENRRDMQFNEQIRGIRYFYRELISLRKRGLFTGKFKALLENDLLVIHLNNKYGEIISVINRHRIRKEIEINNNRITLEPLDFILFKNGYKGIEELIPH